MEVKVNDNLIFANFEKFNNLDQLVQSLCIREHEKGNVITKISINGNDWTHKDPIFLQAVQLNKVSSVRVDSENPFALAKECYQTAICMREILVNTLTKMSHYGNTSDDKAGVNSIIREFFDDLNEFITLIIRPIELLCLDSEQIVCHNRKFSRHIEILFKKVKKMEEKYVLAEVEDFVVWVCDTFSRELASWEHVIFYVQHEIELLQGRQNISLADIK